MSLAAATSTKSRRRHGQTRVTDGAGLAIATPLLLFGEILFYGADRLEVGLVAALGQIALLCGLLLFSRSTQNGLTDRPHLSLLYFLFASLTLWVLVQLSPLTHGMAQDAWAYVGARPAMTIDKFATLAELVKLWGLGAIFLVGLTIGQAPARARICLSVMSLAALLYTAAAIVLFFVMPPDFHGKTPRLAATLLNPNNSSALFSIFAVIGLASALCALRPPVRGKARGAWLTMLKPIALPVLLLGLCMWAASLTGSRGGAIAGIVGLAAAAVPILVRRFAADRLSYTPTFVGWLVAALFASAVVILLVGGGMQERMLMASDGVADRQANIQLYLSRLSNVPWTGFGLGTFHRFNNVIVAAADAAKLWEFGAMHNVFLQWIYEGGWPGAALMFALVAYILRHILRGLGGSAGLLPWAPIALGASGILLTHGLVDFDLQIPAIAALWSFVLGLGFGASPSHRPISRRRSAGKAAGDTPERPSGRRSKTADR